MAGFCSMLLKCLTEPERHRLLGRRQRNDPLIR